MAFLTSANGYIPLTYDNMSYILTTKLNVLVQAGVIALSSEMDNQMAKGGVLHELPFWNDIANSADRQSTETKSILFAGGTNDPDPDGLTSDKEVFAKICRNKSWGVSDLSDSIMLNGDPMNFLVSRSAVYQNWKLQAYFLNVCTGIFADNDLAPGGTEHVQGDLTLDISNAAGAGVFAPGVTTFGAAAHIKALQLLGDNKSKLQVILMHSIIESTIALQDLIETVRDSEGQVLYSKFMGMRIVIDDDMTSPSAGVYDTYYFGLASFLLGKTSPKVPLEEERHAGAGGGAGETVFYRRWEWSLHPRGHKWLLASTGAGPSDAQIQGAASWQRVYPERKQIRIVRVRSREA